MLKVVFSISSDMTRLVQPIPPMHSQENAPKLQIWLASLSQNTVKMRKINRPWPKCKQLKMQWGYICMSNFKPFLPCILKKIVRNPKFDLFHSQNDAKNEENQQTMAKIWLVQKVVRIHQHAKVQAIPPLCSPENVRKLQICLVSLSQNDAKMRKINRWWPKSNQF